MAFAKKSMFFAKKTWLLKYNINTVRSITKSDPAIYLELATYLNILTVGFLLTGDIGFSLSPFFKNCFRLFACINTPLIFYIFFVCFSI